MRTSPSPSPRWPESSSVRGPGWAPVRRRPPTSSPSATRSLRRSSRASAERGSVLRQVAEVGREPALGLLERLSGPGCVVGDLVLTEPADDEVLALRVREVPAGDRGSRPHGPGLRERDPGIRLDVEEPPDDVLA